MPRPYTYRVWGLNMELYPCQAACIEHAVAFLVGAARGARQGYVGPTGVGKSVVELRVQAGLGADRCAIVTPRVEIIAGMRDKGGGENIWTPVMLKNRLLSGDVKPPDFLIYDELHHHEAETWQQIDLLCGCPPSIGFTASYFRGTPRGTADFRRHWGEPVVMATWQEADALGYIKLPSFHMLPLVDDDVVEVSGGEFEVTALEGVTVDRLGDMVNHARRWHDGYRWDLPTIFSAPSRAVATDLAHRLSMVGLPATVVVADTPDRAGLFRAAEASLTALVHVDVVSEGVDLRLRRYVDLSPTLSPVKWLQRLGRVMRPWDRRPEYWCLAEGTPVLTDSGWVEIQDVTVGHMVWDGEEFVTHSGVVYNGVRETIEVHGIWATPDHEFLTEEGWACACDISRDVVPWSGSHSTDGQLSLRGSTSASASASADAQNQCTRQTSTVDGRLDAQAAGSPTNESGAGTLRRSETPSGMRSLDAHGKTTAITSTTVDVVSPCTGLGSKTLPSSWPISQPSPAQLILRLYSTGGTTMGTTSQATYAGSRQRSRTSTSGTRRAAPVYDLLNCGPRSRFQAGPLISHNCTNRNIARHAYALEGAVPSSVVATAERAFPASTRANVRVLGLEAIGRFKPARAPLVGGAFVHVYSLFAVVGSTVAEWACLVPPTGAPLWFCKARPKLADGQDPSTLDWGTWRQEDAPDGLQGFQSRRAAALTDRQKAWWRRAAHRHGLDPNADVDSKAFVALPILKDTGLRVT